VFHLETGEIEFADCGPDCGLRGPAGPDPIADPEIILSLEGKFAGLRTGLRIERFSRSGSVFADPANNPAKKMPDPVPDCGLFCGFWYILKS
jgi:hypothetical protein